MIGKIYCLLIVATSTCANAGERTVAELTIFESGASVHPDTAQMCKQFRPTKAQIKRYLLRAYPVEDHVAIVERFSPCYASGKIYFSDRNLGDWTIFSGGTGRIDWNRGGEVHLLYKGGNGWRDPFARGYSICDNEKC